MANEIKAFPISLSAQSEALAAIAEGDGYKVIGPKDFPSYTPATLRSKFDSATRIVSGSETEQTLVVYNFFRLDKSNVDEHPFGYIVVSGSQAVSGSFLEHGDWDGRTTPVDPAFAAHISSSGLGGFFLGCPPDGRLAGPISELTGSNAAAFAQFKASLTSASFAQGGPAGN